MLQNLLLIVFAAWGLYGTAAEALRDAIWNRDQQRTFVWLSLGADVNARYENELTPVCFADDPKIVKLLIDHRAELNLRDVASLQTPLERAAKMFVRDKERRASWKTIVAQLRAAGAEYTIDTAIYLNDLAHVKEQLRKDASWLNAERGAQQVPLRRAASLGRVEICELLLQHKADPDDFEQGNGYPIMVDAVEHDAVVRLLLKHGANLKRRITWHGFRTGIHRVGYEATALHYAVEGRNAESVKLLLAAGLDASATDDEGQTPLHIALRSDSPPRIIEMLLAHDASLRLKDARGRTPLELAKAMKRPPEIVQMLVNQEEELRRKLHRAWFGDK